MNTNPYAAYLGDRVPLKVAAATGKQLEELFESIGTERIRQSPAPGKWSAHEIICHLADCEIAFGFRLRQALAEEHHVIQPFDQEKWANTYAAYEPRQALAAFSTGREWNISLIRSVSPATLLKPVFHPERGEMTFQTIVETMAGHDVNHLLQLEAIAAGTTANR